ncbi:uncharacterized protein LOC130949203 [Arachis stenosperma]|uniref:uncharacterized protein LOC130949203 n=1 Tax=Arachis stenosperma TaxID=217475 RepID=UPI0025AD10DF|nr:uncharacterized protein LOC130949203 [Arachis stenosperma]
MGSSNTSNNQPASSSSLPSQPLPNTKGGINAITLRSGTTLQERSHEEPSSKEDVPVESTVGVEDAEEEDAVQDMVEEEAAQPRNGAPREEEEIKGAIPIPFPHLARKPRKKMELDPKMVEIFKKVEVRVLQGSSWDAFSRTYPFKIDGRTLSFNLDEAMKHPPEDHSIFQCDIIDETVAEVHQEEVEEMHMEQGASVEKLSELTEDTLPPQIAPDDQVPSNEQKMELKPLPPHLKYAYLEDNQTLEVIIARELIFQQEEQLLSVLRRHKKAIGWSLADIVGIISQVCEHHIFLEEGTRPVRQPQRRLNPTILEVVKKEVTRLLEADIIYPISDSEWVSLVQVVPKKSGVTTVKNDHGELIATRVKNSWRVCIDYRRLNQATRKDHYLLPFID